MNNMRVVYDNAIARATLAASSQASASMSVGKLQNDLKSNVWRSSGGTFASLSASWSSLEPISFSALPFCNLSSTATKRVRATNEAQATNLLRYSQQFDNAAWAVTGGTVTLTANYGSAPDGSNTAYRLQFSGPSQTLQQNTSLGVGVLCSGSVWIKGNAGETISVSAGGVDQQVALTGSWQRIASLGKTSVTANFNINTFSGGTARDVQIWAAQLETGSVATSYYPTTSAAATRPLGYIDSWQSYSYDSGAVQCCPETPLKPRGWTAAQAASAYAYGGGACARVWFPQISAYGIRVDINDVNNLQGYIEAACWVVGPYWSTSFNPSGVKVTPMDTTQHTRTDAGDQWTDPGKVYMKMSVDLSMMPSADRANFVNLVRSSKAYPIFVSVFPQNGDTALERDTMLYGRRSNDSDIALQICMTYGSTIELESI